MRYVEEKIMSLFGLMLKMIVLNKGIRIYYVCKIYFGIYFVVVNGDLFWVIWIRELRFYIGENDSNFSYINVFNLIKYNCFFRIY